MKNVRLKHIISTGLAIFSMLFGAGNLMYPLQVGMVSGPLTWIGMIGFAITAVCLPIAGLIGMLLFNGDFRAFYYRLGPVAGSILLFISILIIGPMVAIPRITTLSHTIIFANYYGVQFMPICVHIFGSYLFGNISRK
jgi:LIVCS family branched-chain amino acid:cation transporter